MPVPRLQASLAHLELAVIETREDAMRPRFVCRVVHRAAHAPFEGFNRAQAAVIEGAVLVSRLHLLPRSEVEAEMSRLAIVVGKTAGDNEAEAWSWLVRKAARLFCRGGGRMDVIPVVDLIGGRVSTPGRAIAKRTARS